MNILFTICARAGSKGVKSKNIRTLVGKPLVYYTYRAYQSFVEQYKNQEDMFYLAVNTDSKELIHQLDDMNANYIYVTRKEELAGDTVSKISVIRDTQEKAELITKVTFDYTIDLDLTSPFRTVSDVKGTLDAVVNNTEADIAFSVTESRRSPYFNMVNIKENGYYDRVIEADYVSRQQVPVCYDMNASIYAYRREYLMSGREGKRKSVIWKMKDTAVLDIDCEEDFEIMEILAPYFFDKTDELVR